MRKASWLERRAERITKVKNEPDSCGVSTKSERQAFSKTNDWKVPAGQRNERKGNQIQECSSQGTMSSQEPHGDQFQTQSWLRSVIAQAQPHLIPPSTTLYAFGARRRPRRHRDTSPIMPAILPAPHSSYTMDNTTFAITAISSITRALNGSGSKIITPAMACGGHNRITTLNRDNSPIETTSQPRNLCS
jgi:hypothetical protein